MKDTSLITFISEWSSVLILCIQGLFAWALWSLRQTFVNKTDFNGLGTRLNSVEHKLDTMPTASDVAKILTRMEIVSGDIRVISERMEGQEKLMARVERGLDRITDHHLKE